MPGFLSSIFGSKPSVPNLPQLSLPAEQQKALAANLAAIPQSEQIATQVDLFNQEQVDKMLENVIPNYAAIRGNVSQNIASLTAGQIPTDVSQAVQRSDAAQAVGGGFAGSEAQKNLVARDLGLTSLDLTQRGLNSAESWIKTASSIYQPGMFNVSSMFISPAQQASFDVEERNAQFQRQWMANQIAAQPAMWAQDLKEAVQTAISIWSHAPPQHAGTLPVQGSDVGSNYTNFFQGGGGGMDTGGGYTDFFGGGGDQSFTDIAANPGDQSFTDIPANP